MLRREVLASIAALAAVPSVSWADEPGLQLGDAVPFEGNTVTDQDEQSNTSGETYDDSVGDEEYEDASSSSA